MTDDRLLCGLRVASDLPLPDLLPWAGPARVPDVEVRLGGVPARVADPRHEGPLMQVGADGTCRFAVPGVAAYWIEAGRRITIQPVLPADAPDIRVFLLGNVFAMLCHQRGLLPLQGAGVEIGGRALVLAGRSGVGKSTLALALQRRGHRILSDDVTVIDTAAPGGPRVLPGVPRLRLWRDMFRKLDRTIEGLETVRPDLYRFNLPLGPSFCADPLPLVAIVIVDRTQLDLHAGFVPLARGARLADLTAVVASRTMAWQAGFRPAVFAALTRLGTVPASGLSLMHEVAALDATAARVAGHIMDAADREGAA